MIRHKVDVTFLKKPTNPWKLWIGSNPSTDFIPIIIEEYKSNQIKLDLEFCKGEYLGKEKIIKIRFIYLLDDNVHSTKSYNFKDFELKNQIKFDNNMILQFSNHQTVKETLSTSNSIKKQKITKLRIPKKYIKNINDKLFKFKYHPHKFVIYFCLNPFIKLPIICSLILYKEKSNVTFWENVLQLTKDIYHAHGMKFNMSVCFPTMFTIKNACIDKYVLEIYKDTYLETWGLKTGDCDEANVAYKLYRMFMKCDVSSSPELLKIQTYISKNYKCFYLFNMVTQPSASFVENMLSSKKDLQGHWIIIFLPRRWFYSCCQGKTLKKKDKLPVLIGEPTALFYPDLYYTKPNVKNLLKGERKFQFFKNSNFYRYFNTLYCVDHFWDKGVFGFYCGIGNTYGVKISDLMRKRKGIRFVPLPKMSKKERDDVKHFMDYTIRTPNLLINENGKHVPFYVTTEPVKRKLERISEFFNENFEVVEEMDAKPIYFTIYSFDDLYRKNIRMSLLSRFAGRKLKVKRYEYMYNNFFYILQFF